MYRAFNIIVITNKTMILELLAHNCQMITFYTNNMYTKAH